METVTGIALDYPFAIVTVHDLILPRSLRSLDIFGHWNAKRSSVTYLTYWALNVGWPAFEMVFPYWWTWKETVGGANWRFRRSQKKSSPNSCKQTEQKRPLARSRSIYFVQADEDWSSVGERELYSLRLVSRM
ncbi:hypothetical protein TNCV_1092461 [Trichonephila clavipes]|nr:hypothetical protein TNCV_1092461 [Trichonephila clavipes]